MTAQTKPLPKVNSVAINVNVQGSNSRQYLVYVATDGAWVCPCPAWRNQAGVVGKDRVCKHTKAAAVALGEMVVKTLGG